LVTEYLDHWLIQTVVIGLIIVLFILVAAYALMTMAEAKMARATKNMPKLGIMQALGILLTSETGQKKFWEFVSLKLGLNK